MRIMVFTGLAVVFLSRGVPLPGQISLSSAVTLALQNSPRVKIAQDDVDRARAALTESKDAYIPRIGATGGVGSSYGITLGVPTIFTIGAQSLVFSFSQRNYLRATKLELHSAMLSLNDACDAVVQDAAETYVALDHAQEKMSALIEEYAAVERLGTIVEERHKAGLESDQEARITRRAGLQIRLQRLEMEDETAVLREHLAELMGLPADQLATVADSIPSDKPSDFATMTYPGGTTDSLAVLAATANAQAKQERAIGDSRFQWRPLVTLDAQYGRVSPINGVTDYYNIHGNYNTAFAALQIQIPFLDAARKARAKETAADASRTSHELASLQSRQREDRARMKHSINELSAREELAELDAEIAQDQLRATLVQMSRGGLGGAPATPKDEQNARIRERQRYVELLDARLALRKVQIDRLRQTGELRGWVQGSTRLLPGTLVP